LSPCHLVIAALLLLLPACKKKVADNPAPTTQAALVQPAPKPTAPLAQNASCITPACHPTFKTAAHIHGPVSSDSCFACHAQDTGNHTYPLARTGNALCTFCHAVAGTKPFQHKALDMPKLASKNATSTLVQSEPGNTGGCLNCHNPHISSAKFLLVTDTVDALCIRCHDEPLKKFGHQPFVAGQCTVCHQAHQSDYAKLLRNGDGSEHCFGCHTDKRDAMAKSSHVHAPAQKACTTCHGPHSTDNARLLKQPVNDTCLTCHTKIKEQLASSKHTHGAVTEGNCASCHDPHASNQTADLKARTDKVCLTCHNGPVKAQDGRTIKAMGPVLASQFLHGPVKSGSCSDCHMPHASDQPNLLTKYFPATFYAKFDIQNYALCFSCHDAKLALQKDTTVTNFRDGARNLHFVHVNRDEKGRTCKTCHDIHGSDLPNHMATSVPFEGSTWAMPINYQKSQDGGSCTPGCHDQKTYNRNLPSTRGEP